MRIIFAGTPHVAVKTLNALHDAGHDIAMVISREDAPIGRKRVLTPSPVAVRAAELGLDVLKLAQQDDRLDSLVAQSQADVGIVVAFGALLREPVLSAPRHGWLNVHFSSLPKWRGAAPVQRALMAGERTLGISIFRLDAGMDTGPILAHDTCEFPKYVTAGECLETLGRAGAVLLRETLEKISREEVHLAPQNGESSLAPKLQREDGRLDWDASADQIINTWAGTTPEPGAFTHAGDTVVKIIALTDSDAAGVSLENHMSQLPALTPGQVFEHKGLVFVGTGTLPVCIRSVQPAGRNMMTAADWLRGREEGVRFQ